MPKEREVLTTDIWKACNMVSGSLLTRWLIIKYSRSFATMSLTSSCNNSNRYQIFHWNKALHTQKINSSLKIIQKYRTWPRKHKIIIMKTKKWITTEIIRKYSCIVNHHDEMIHWCKECEFMISWDTIS